MFSSLQGYIKIPKRGKNPHQLSTTLSPIIMVQWNMAGFFKKGNDPIGDTPIFHGTMIYGRKVVVNSEATHLQGLMVYQGTQPLLGEFF